MKAILSLTLLALSFQFVSPSAQAKWLYNWEKTDTAETILAAGKKDSAGHVIVDQSVIDSIIAHSRAVNEAGKGLNFSNQAFQTDGYGPTLLILEVSDNYRIPNVDKTILKQHDSIMPDGQVPPLADVSGSDWFILDGVPKDTTLTLHPATAADAEEFWKAPRTLSVAITEMSNLAPVLTSSNMDPRSLSFAKAVIENGGYAFLSQVDESQIKDNDAMAYLNAVKMLGRVNTDPQIMDVLHNKLLRIMILNNDVGSDQVVKLSLTGNLEPLTRTLLIKYFESSGVRNTKDTSADFILSLNTAYQSVQSFIPADIQKGYKQLFSAACSTALQNTKPVSPLAH